jgi:hypothetical protein
MGRSPRVIAKKSCNNNHKNHKKMAIATKAPAALPMSRVCETWTDKMTHSTNDLLHDDDDDADLYMSTISRCPPSLHRGRCLPALWKLKAFSETMALTSSSFVLPRHSNDCDTTGGSTAGGDDDDTDDEWLPPPPPSFASSHSIITSREDMEIRVEELRSRFRTCGRGRAPQQDCCGY